MVENEARRTRYMKHLTYQLCTQNPDLFTIHMYKSESKLFLHLMRSSRRKYETVITSLATSNPKVFFAHVRRNRHVTLKTDLGVNIKESEEQAELLNEFYDTIFRPDNGQPIPTLPIQLTRMDIPYLPLASSTKSPPRSIPQWVQALINCALGR